MSSQIPASATAGLSSDIGSFLTQLEAASKEASKLSFMTTIATIKAKQEADAMKNIR